MWIGGVISKVLWDSPVGQEFVSSGFDHVWIRVPENSRELNVACQPRHGCKTPTNILFETIPPSGLSKMRVGLAGWRSIISVANFWYSYTSRARRSFRKGRNMLGGMLMHARKSLVLCGGMAVVLFMTVATSQAEIKLPEILGSRMVLQRDMPVPIWGTARRGETITVKFRDQTKTTVVGEDGKWMLRLAPLTAGGPDAMIISGSARDSQTMTLEDVLVGEVWLGSGQSNMQTSPKSSFLEAEKLKQPRDEKMARNIEQTYPQVRLFIRTPYTKPPHSWKFAEPANNLRFSALMFEFGIQLHAELKVPVGVIVGAEGGTTSSIWIPKEAFDGDPAIQKAITAFAPRLEVLRRKAQEDLEKWKQTVAATQPNATPTIRVPVPPAENKGIGQNFRRFIQPNLPFAIRGVLWDQGESDTGIEGVDQFTLMGGLISSWRTEWGQGDFPWIYIQKPSGWGCALNPDDPVTARAVPFAPLPARPPWGYDGGGRRVMYDRIRQHPSTAMAVVSDLGVGLHPLDKSAYATRAVRAAMKIAYQAPIDIYGPTFKSMDISDDGKVRIHYDNVGPGLAVVKDKPLQGFAIAGEDRNWRWAEAKIEGDTVVVWNSKVSKPVAVRYGWGDRMPWATLFSKNGLPAMTFRTDDWPEKAPENDAR